MISFFLLFIILIVLAAADTSILPNIFGQNVHPSVLLVAVIIWSARAKYENVWLRSAAAGFFSDIFSWNAVGPGIFSFSLVSALIGFLAKRFMPPHKTGEFFSLLVFVVLGTAVQNLVYNIFFLNSNNIKYLGFEIFFNVLIFAAVYWPISKAEKLLKN